MELQAPSKVGEARPLWLIREGELTTLKAIARELPAGGTRRELEAVIAGLKTTIFGKGMIEQDFRYPDGKIQTFTLWDAPGGRPTIMFPVTTYGRIIWLRQWRPAAAVNDPSCKFIYELPGGNPKKGEIDPPHEKVAADELLEETGYRARQWRRLHPTSVWFEPANLTPPFTPLIGLDCERVREAEPDDTELIEVVEFSIAESRVMIRRGDVRDSKSIAIFFLALQHISPWQHFVWFLRRLFSR